MEITLFDYGLIADRASLPWAEGAPVAFHVGPTVEHCQVDRPSTSIFADTAGLALDPVNHEWRDGACLTTSNEIAAHDELVAG